MPVAMISWTPKKIDALRTMWLDGKSAGQIAAVIGVSRDSVLGRVYRMGLARNGHKPAVKAPRVAAPPTPPRQMQRLPQAASLWSMPEDKRRALIAKRASAAARAQLEAAGL